MRLPIAAGLVTGLVGSATAAKYGYNHVPLQPDSEIVASAFKDVDVELLSPAFIDEENRLPAFSEGTKGPSNQETMGKLFPIPPFRLPFTSSGATLMILTLLHQRTSCRISPAATST